MVQERIHERARVVAVSGVDYHALRLVDHQQVGVLIDDVKRDILGNGVHSLWLGYLCLYRLSAAELVVLADGLAVREDQSVGDEPLYG